MSTQSLSELDYELIVSRRAKRASLRVLPGRGLMVTIPQRFPRSDVLAFIQRNRAWIDSSLAEIDANTPLAFRQWPPFELPLAALGVNLALDFIGAGAVQKSTSTDLNGNTEKVSSYSGMNRHPALPHSEALKGTLQQDNPTQLRRTIHAPVDNKAAVSKEVAKLLKTLAREFLPPLLASYAHLHGLQYQRVSIRGQRTRWGSYSSTGTLSLNYKLLFLSRELVDYVLLHELAHTVHLNHSEAFWQLLCRLNVNARVLDRKLRQAGRSVPPWLV